MQGGADSRNAAIQANATRQSTEVLAGGLDLDPLFGFRQARARRVHQADDFTSEFRPWSAYAILCRWPFKNCVYPRQSKGC